MRGAVTALGTLDIMLSMNMLRERTGSVATRT
jgi:hypothetical protein